MFGLFQFAKVDVVNTNYQFSYLMDVVNQSECCKMDVVDVYTQFQFKK